jgi:hypothetical protein
MNGLGKEMKFILIVTEEASEKTKYFGPFNSGEEALQWGLGYYNDDYILMSTTLYDPKGEKK